MQFSDFESLTDRARPKSASLTWHSESNNKLLGCNPIMCYYFQYHDKINGKI